MIKIDLKETGLGVLGPPNFSSKCSFIPLFEKSRLFLSSSHHPKSKRCFRFEYVPSHSGDLQAIHDEKPHVLNMMSIVLLVLYT